MKICLIRPPKIIPSDSIFAIGTYQSAQGPSIGLAFIANALVNANHDVSVVDCLGEGLDKFQKYSKLKAVINGIGLEEMLSKIPADVEVFGITMMFSIEWFYYELIVNLLREKFPKAKIIAGGEHISAEYKNVLDINSAIDYCVIGEGEETIVELITAIESNQSTDQIPGLAFVRNKVITRTAPRNRLKKIDEIGTPLWDKFPMKNYLDNNSSLSMTNRRAIPILASRGCPYMCTFCTNKDMWGTDLYLRSPDLIIEEIKENVRKYQIEHLDFCDAVGVLNRKWIVELLTKLKAANLNITWLHMAGTRSEILDDEVLTLFKESGAQKITYAPESGSKEELKRMKKNLNLENILNSMKLAIKKKVVLKTHIMYGTPGQSLNEVRKSILFGMKMAFLGVEDLSVHLFSAHPGTQDYFNLINAGKINLEEIKAQGKYAEFLLSQSYGKTEGVKSWADNIPPWILPKLQILTYLSFFGVYYLTKPWRVFVNFNRAFIKKKPISSIENVLFRLAFSKNKDRFEDFVEIRVGD